MDMAVGIAVAVAVAVALVVAVYVAVAVFFKLCYYPLTLRDLVVSRVQKNSLNIFLTNFVPTLNIQICALQENFHLKRPIVTIQQVLHCARGSWVHVKQ